MIITIDGPSGAGKGTLGKKLSSHLGFSYLDTGLMFRALAYKATITHTPMNEEALAHLALTLTLEDWDQNALRTDDMAHVASQLATYGPVRLAIKQRIQDFVATNKSPGVILDGRDMGTVVCPQASKKLFITASAKIRAQRRFTELQLNGFTGTLAKVLSDIERRDKRDQSRELAPLKPAHDAMVIDTSHLSRTDVFNLALNYIQGPDFS